MSVMVIVENKWNDSCENIDLNMYIREKKNCTSILTHMHFNSCFPCSDICQLKFLNMQPWYYHSTELQCRSTQAMEELCRLQQSIGGMCCISHVHLGSSSFYVGMWASQHVT